MLKQLAESILETNGYLSDAHNDYHDNGLQHKERPRYSGIKKNIAYDKFIKLILVKVIIVCQIYYVITKSISIRETLWLLVLISYF